MALSGGLPHLTVPRLTPIRLSTGGYGGSPLAAGILAAGQGISHGIDALTAQDMQNARLQYEATQNAPLLAMRQLALREAQYRASPQFLEDQAAASSGMGDYVGGYQPTTQAPDQTETLGGRIPFAVTSPREGNSPAPLPPDMYTGNYNEVEQSGAGMLPTDAAPAVPVTQEGDHVPIQSAYQQLVPGATTPNAPPSLGGLLKAKPELAGPLSRLQAAGVAPQNPGTIYDAIQKRHKMQAGEDLESTGLDALRTAKTPADRYAALLTIARGNLQKGGKGLEGFDKLTALGDTEDQRQDNLDFLKAMPVDALAHFLQGVPTPDDVHALATEIQAHPGSGIAKKFSDNLTTELLKDQDMHAFKAAYDDARAHGANPVQALMAGGNASPAGLAKLHQGGAIGILAPELEEHAAQAKAKGETEGKLAGNPDAAALEKAKVDTEVAKAGTEKARTGEITARTKNLGDKSAGGKAPDVMATLAKIDAEIKRVQNDPEMLEEDRAGELAYWQKRRADTIQADATKANTTAPVSTKGDDFASLEPGAQKARLTDALKGVPREQRTDRGTVAKSFRSYVVSRLFRGKDPASLSEADQQRALSEIDAMMAAQFPGAVPAGR